MKRLSGFWRILLGVTVLTIILNLLAFYKPFCNYYADNIYGYLNAVLGTLPHGALFP